MKNFLIAIIVIGVIAAGVYFIWPQPDEPTEKDIIAATVNNYIRFTLGSVPGTQVDYEMAKEYLTPDLRSQFTSPMFIPESYCIQDGPDDFRIESIMIDKENGLAKVVIKTKYGQEDWQEMWEFDLVNQEENWKINNITCLHI